MLDHSITERKIEDRHFKTDNDPDDPEFNNDCAQITVDQLSYGEQSIIDVSDNVTRNWDTEVTKAWVVLEQTENIMKTALRHLNNKAVKAEITLSND